jgi:hypothetical protein
VPQQIHPQIDQDKSQSNKQQSDYWILGSGADPAGIFDSVAGFDAKSLFVMMI